MSFNTEFSTPLLQTLKAEMRKRVQAQTGQLLILDNISQLKAAIQKTLPGVIVSDNTLRTALKAGREHASRLQKGFKSMNPERFDTLVAKINSGDLGLSKSKVLGKNMFLVTNFADSISRVKKTILQKLVQLSALNSKQAGQVAAGLDKAAGSSVAQVQVAASLASLEPKDLAAVQQAFETGTKGVIVGDQRKEIQKIFNTHKSIVDRKGNLKDTYVSVISLQTGSKTRGVGAQTQKDLKRAYTTFIRELGDKAIRIGPSPTINKIEKVIVDAALPRKSRNIKVKKNPKVSGTKLRTSSKSTKNSNTTKGAVALSRKNSRKAKRSKTSTSSPLFLLGVLNEQLPRVVAQNMGTPALNYRTGRFASSTRVTAITQTRKGFPSVAYTYQRAPYETFEIGGAQGSAARDPRTLIDASIREIASEFAIGRFFTRRV